VFWTIAVQTAKGLASTC